MALLAFVDVLVKELEVVDLESMNGQAVLAQFILLILKIAQLSLGFERIGRRLVHVSIGVVLEDHVHPLVLRPSLHVPLIATVSTSSAEVSCSVVGVFLFFFWRLRDYILIVHLESLASLLKSHNDASVPCDILLDNES
jgi:hypothetical protein